MSSCFPVKISSQQHIYIYKIDVIQKFKTHERVMSVAAVYAAAAVVPADSEVVVAAVARQVVARVDVVDSAVVAAAAVVALEPIAGEPAAAP